MPDRPQPTTDDDLSDWPSSEFTPEVEPEEWPEEEDSKENDSWEIETTADAEDTPDFEEEAGDFEENDLDDLGFAPTVVVGHREHVSLPQLGLHQVLAHFSSDSSVSAFHAEIHQSRGDHVTFKLDQLELELPAFEQANALWVALQLELAGVVLEGAFKVVSTSGQPFLVVGRDLMAGHVLIDPSGEWLKSRR